MSQREEYSLVCILKSFDKYCLVQRPDTGLLANLFEFPSINLQDWSKNSTMTKALASKYMEEYYNIKVPQKQVCIEISQALCTISIFELNY